MLITLACTFNLLDYFSIIRDPDTLADRYPYPSSKYPHLASLVILKSDIFSSQIIRIVKNYSAVCLQPVAGRTSAATILGRLLISLIG